MDTHRQYPTLYQLLIAAYHAERQHEQVEACQEQHMAAAMQVEVPPKKE